MFFDFILIAYSFTQPIFVNFVLSVKIVNCEIFTRPSGLAVERTARRLLYESLFLFSVILWAAIHVFK